MSIAIFAIGALLAFNGWWIIGSVLMVFAGVHIMDPHKEW